MIRLLQWLFTGHIHKWKTIADNPLRVSEGSRQVALGHRYVQQCEHCGTIAQRDII